MPTTVTLLAPSDRARNRNAYLSIDIHDEEFALDWGYGAYPFRPIIIEEEWMAWWAACTRDSETMTFATPDFQLTMRYYEDTADYGMSLRWPVRLLPIERWRVAKRPATLARQALRYLAESGDIRVARLAAA